MKKSKREFAIRRSSQSYRLVEYLRRQDDKRDTRVRIAWKLGFTNIGDPLARARRAGFKINNNIAWVAGRSESFLELVSEKEGRVTIW